MSCDLSVSDLTMPPVWGPPRPALHCHPTYTLLLLFDISLPLQAPITQPPTCC
jgi:hypothetical protein